MDKPGVNCMTGINIGDDSGIRVAVYARYSSDLQRDASIEDQVRGCAAIAQREGWRVKATFSDSATSGATTLRAGYQDLLSAIRAGGIDIVLAESLDRFSRDLEHIASFHKQCVFHQVRIHTLAEGNVSELHIGLKGTMGALYLKDLADKTRRGLEGRIHAGRCTGTPPYGYTVVRRLGPDGELDRGLRAIDPARAAVVRRVFELYAGGASPRRIALTLNAEGIPGPSGGSWFAATILGRAKRADGLLRNELYVARLVWRRRVNAKDPTSGARVRRSGRPEDQVEKQMPDLRIIDDELWDRVKQRMKDEAAIVRFGGKSGQHAFWDRRRPRHLLTGKVVCGVCGRAFKMSGKDYLRCRAASDGGCSNRRTVRLRLLEGHVLSLLQRQLMQPELVAEFITAFNAELHRLTSELRVQAASSQRERSALERKIANLVDAISDGRTSPAILAKLSELESQRAKFVDVPTLPPVPSAALQPGIADIYRAKVAKLAALLSAGDHPEALEAARALIEKVIIHPPDTDDDPPGVELVGELMSLLKAAGIGQAGVGDHLLSGDPVLGLFVSSIKAGPGAEPLAFLDASRSREQNTNMSQPAAITALRGRIRLLERPVARPGGVLPFSVPALDLHLPEGGLALGALHEVAGGGVDEVAAASATLFAAGILARLERPVLWCSALGDLFPPGLACAGLGADRVLHVAAGHERAVLPVMEEALRHPGLSAVVGELARLPMVASRRLVLAAEKSGVMALALRRRREGAAAETGLSAAATRWRITPLPSAPLASPGLGRARWQVSLLRCRGGEAGEWIMEACDAQGYLATPAELAGRAVAPGADRWAASA